MTNTDLFANVPAFPECRKGYDPLAVDQYLQTLQIQVDNANMQLVDAEARLRMAAVDVRPIENESAATLRAAKQAADETIAEAKQHAVSALQEARDRAGKIVADAQARMDHARSVNEKIEQMKTETARYVDDAKRHVQAMRTKANEESVAMQDAATEAARLIREEAELSAADVRRRADADAISLRHDARNQITQAQEAIRKAEDRLLNEAKTAAAEYVAAAELEAEKTITDARCQGAIMLGDAQQSAERTTTDALVAARAALAEATTTSEEMITTARITAIRESEQIRQQIQQDIDSLTRQQVVLGDTVAAQEAVLAHQRQALTASIEQMQLTLNDPLSDTVTINLNNEDNMMATTPINDDDLIGELVDNSL